MKTIICLSASDILLVFFLWLMLLYRWELQKLTIFFLSSICLCRFLYPIYPLICVAAAAVIDTFPDFFHDKYSSEQSIFEKVILKTLIAFLYHFVNVIIFFLKIPLINMADSKGPAAFDPWLHFVCFPQPNILHVEWIWCPYSDLPASGTSWRYWAW